MSVPQDVKYAAWAVFMGFTLVFSEEDQREGMPSGLPHRELNFRLGKCLVFRTARGWRVARYGDDGQTFLKPKDSDFHSRLRVALQHALCQEGTA